MQKINITFPDNSIKTIDKEMTAKELILNEIGEGLARAAIAVEIDGVKKDITTPITKDCKFRVLTFKNLEGKEIFWHSSAHILALAVKRLFKDVKLTIGPAIESGFYYDFDINKPFTEKDLLDIEQEAKKIIKEKLYFKRMEIDYQKALELTKDQEYKQEMIKELKEKGEKITFYNLGDEFFDLCRGPHIEHTKKVKSFKLTKISGAYYKGDSNNKQLQRIYGISFDSKEKLKEHLNFLEEAQKRDHRKIGKELDLFSFHKEAPGMPFFHDNGTFVFNKLIEYITEVMVKRNYEINKTPMILNKSLWLQSGHWDHYKDDMYFTKIDKEDYAVKPMNCPGNILIYKAHQYSYRELPIRAGEFGLVHRNELSGVLSGLFRVRAFTQDDAHVFCSEDQLKHEIKDLMNLMDEVYKTFGFDYNIFFSTKPKKAMGFEDKWELAEKILKEVLDENKKPYTLNPGDGAFYGPKIDFQIKDALNRTWQCGTIQLDFQMPEKFDLTYEDKDNQKKRPVMLHRAVYGSVERFMGNIIEHTKGKFPLWISPRQVRIIPIADRHTDYAKEIKEKLKDFRVDIDSKTETVNKKIRNAQLKQINYIIVVGDKEQENKTINIRTRNQEIIGEMEINQFIEKLKKEVREKTL